MGAPAIVSGSSTWTHRRPSISRRCTRCHCRDERVPHRHLAVRRTPVDGATCSHQHQPGYGRSGRTRSRHVPRRSTQRAEQPDADVRHRRAALLGAITALAAWQAGRLLAPLSRLNDTAQEISSSDLSSRIPETGNDDITDLTRTLNQMLSRLTLICRATPLPRRCRP